MKTGLIIGKFMPLHKGHIALIEFALGQCDELIVLVSASDDEPIIGTQRLQWLEELYKDNSRVKPRMLNYDDLILLHADTTISSEGLSKLWAGYLMEQLPPIDVIFASEAYGAYMSRFLNCEAVIYDEPCKIVPVSASQIRNDPFTYFTFLPDVVQAYYTQEDDKSQNV
jgi:HTH-type transcriptional repressor of NAD biosynthesis genes